MQRLVQLDTAADLQRLLEAAAWHQVDGVELDVAALGEEQYHTVEEVLHNADVHVTSLHDTRTETVALREEQLFRNHLDRLVARCNRLSCGHLSVHPPRVEIGEHHTIKELQAFMRRINTYAADADIRLAFTLTGFMHDPQLMNLAFEPLDEPSLGVAVDMDDLPHHIDPDQLLGKLAIGIDKVRAPLPLHELEQTWSRDDDVIAVAETL